MVGYSLLAILSSLGTIAHLKAWGLKDCREDYLDSLYRKKHHDTLYERLTCDIGCAPRRGTGEVEENKDKEVPSSKFSSKVSMGNNGCSSNL